MSATSLYSEIKTRIKKSRQLKTSAQFAQNELRYEEFRNYLGQAELVDSENREWIRGVILGRTAELCSLLVSKKWPRGVPYISGARTEATYPEVIEILYLIPDYELATLLPDSCFSQFKRIR